MDDMEILCEMIHENARKNITYEHEYQKPSVVLQEAKAPDSCVKICNLPSDSCIIIVDPFDPTPLFQGKKGECKRADYLIISAQEQCMLFIEIKRTTDKKEKIIQQLMGADCLMLYCQEIGKSFWKKKKFLQNYRKRFISICYTNINKQKTRLDPDVYDKHDSPDKFMRVHGNRILQFKKLLGK